MKRFLLGIFIIVLGLSVKAEGGPSYFSLRSGFSVPLGDYKLQNLDEGCFTITGISFAAEGVWYFLRNIGVGIDVNYSLHPVDAVGLATEMVSSDPFLTDMTTRSDPYSILTITGGFFYSMKLFNRISFQPKLLAGAMFGKTPFQLFEPTYFLVGPEYFKITSSRDIGITVKPGLSIIYDISNCISVSSYLDYTYSQLSFGFITSKGQEYRDRKISYLDIGLGLIISL
jgi:hypothetical protein